MHTFILAMILHPDIQKRAQVEVDRIVGDERLPSFADRGQLPFIEAIIKECLRWKCVAPLSELSCSVSETDPIKDSLPAFPHCATQDDIHDGYFIPKGTTVLANIWNAPFISNFDTSIDKTTEQGNPTRPGNIPGSRLFRPKQIRNGQW